MTRKTQFKPQRLIDGGYLSLSDRIAFSVWILKQNKTIYLGKWHEVGLSQQFFNYSANPHTSWHKIDNNGQILVDGFINILCKSQNQATEEVCKKNNLKLSGYKMLNIPERHKDEGVNKLGYLLYKLEALNCRVFNNDYMQEDRNIPLTSKTLLKTYLAINDFGKLSIQVFTGEESGGLWDYSIHPNKDEHVYDFVNRVLLELDDSLAPLDLGYDEKDRSTNVSIYERAFLERKLKKR